MEHCGPRLGGYQKWNKTHVSSHQRPVRVIHSSMDDKKWGNLFLPARTNGQLQALPTSYPCLHGWEIQLRSLETVPHLDNPSPRSKLFSCSVCACLCLRFCCFPLPLFPSPCSLAAIFHWFRGFKRLLLIVLGFICLFFYFFICNWSSWFLVTGVRSNSTWSKKLRISRDLSFALLVWLNLMCLIYVFCVISLWNSEKEKEESVQSFLVLTFKQSKLSGWIDSRFLAVISSVASSVL